MISSLVYLDNAATSFPKPEEVYQAINSFMRNIGASPGRSGHQLSIEAARIIYEAREAVAELFGIADPLRVIFTTNATEALNLVIQGTVHPGEHVITSSMEHNSVMRPLRALGENGVELTIVNCSPEGFLDPDDVERAIKPNTKLIMLNHASNVIGTLLPVGKVGEIAHRYSILFAVDAAQTAGSYPINMETMHINLLIFSGHKSLFGPQGTGGLCISPGADLLLEPLKQGGTGSRSEEEHQPDFLPDKYESGTPNTPGLAGLGAGVCFVLTQGIISIREKEKMLLAILIDGLKAIPGIILHGVTNPEEQIPVLSFNITGLSPSEVAMELEEEYYIMCRPGLHCAPIAHKTMGTFPQGTVRLSLGYLNNRDDIEMTIKAIKTIVRNNPKRRITAEERSS